MAMGRPGVDSAEGAQIDDPASDGTEVGDRFTSEEEWPPRVCLEHAIPLLEGHLIERSGFIKRGIVHEDVNPAMQRYSLRDRFVNGLLRTHLTLDCLSLAAEILDLLNCLVCVRSRTAISDRDIGAGSSQTKGDCPTDAARAPGDQCRFASQGESGHLRIGRVSTIDFEACAHYCCLGWLESGVESDWFPESDDPLFGELFESLSGWEGLSFPSASF